MRWLKYNKRLHLFEATHNVMDGWVVCSSAEGGWMHQLALTQPTAH